MHGSGGLRVLPSACARVPASSEPALRAKGAELQILAELVTALEKLLVGSDSHPKKKCFARVGLRRDYLLKLLAVMLTAFLTLGYWSSRAIMP